MIGQGGFKGEESLQEAARHLLIRWAHWRGKQAGPPWNWALEDKALTSLWPLLYWAFRGEEGALTGEAREQGKLAYFRTARQALVRERSLAEALAALAAAGVRVIACKGVLLTETVYAGPGLRGMADVDIIVPRSQIVAAAQVLQGLGYDLQAKVSLASQQGAVFAYGEASFHPTGSQSWVVDLHWHWVSTYFFRAGSRVDMSGIWERAKPVTLAGQSVLQMAAEDALLHLCYHLSMHHRLADLRAYFDIDRAVQEVNGTLDWTIVASRAREWRLRPVVYWALACARDLLGTPVPNAALEALRPGGWHPSRLAVRLAHPRRRLAEGRSLPGSIQKLWEILLADRRLDQLRVLKEALWPHRAVLAARHGVPDSWSVYALYPRRLWRRMRKAIPFDI